VNNNLFKKINNSVALEMKYLHVCEQSSPNTILQVSLCQYGCQNMN